MDNKKVTLTIDGLDANQKKSSTKIQYINPNASDDVMRTFANKCAALSTDTHTATMKTTDEDITTAATPKPKVSVTLTTSATATLTYNYVKQQSSGVNFGTLFNERNLPSYTYKIAWLDNDDAKDLFLLNLFDDNDGGTSRPMGMVFYSAYMLEDPRSRDEFGPTQFTICFEETDTTAATAVQVLISQSVAPVLTIL